MNTSGWTSNARFPGRSPVPGGLFKSPNLEAYTTAMNVSQREGLGTDGIMANDRAPPAPHYPLMATGARSRLAITRSIMPYCTAWSGSRM